MLKTRVAAFIIGALDAVAWALIAMATFLSGSDPATRGLDIAAGIAVTALFLLTGLPARVLSWRDRMPRLALGLALAFPGVFAVLLIAVVMSLA